jgi:ribosome biogenesis GTPase
VAKRHISKQQAFRIQKIQDERIARAQKREARAEALIESGNLGSEQEGLIIAHYGTQLDVEALQGDSAGQVFRCHLRTNLEQLVTGDRVIWQPALDADVGVVSALLPRRSLLTRPDPYGKLKPVAANIDRILLVIAPLPIPSASLVDRYLVACEIVGISPVILLNKADLINDDNRAELEAMLEEFRQIGYEVRHTAALDGQLGDLLDFINGRTVVFVGQSGVGKSSIVNALLPDVQQKTAEISAGSQLGQHTTTTARLFHLPGGGELIDSPGIREFGLWHITREQLLEGFVDFRPFLGLCRFRNCAHAAEPGCALHGAVTEGKLSARRLASFHKLAEGLEPPPFGEPRSR